MRTAVSCALPCVAALIDNDEYILLLRPEDLESCRGEVSKLQERIVEALKEFGFQVDEYYSNIDKNKLSDTCIEKLEGRQDTDAVVPF